MAWELCALCSGKGYQNVHKMMWTNQFGDQVRSDYLCREHRQEKRRKLASNGIQNVITLHPAADPEFRGVRHKQERPPGVLAPLKSSRVRRKVLLLIERDGPTCRWCGCELSLDATWSNNRILPPRFPTLDHVVERAKGGTHALKNLVLACQPCNSDRSNKEGAS